METKRHALIVEDEETWQDILTEMLQLEDYTVSIEASYAGAQTRLQRESWDLAVVDLALLGTWDMGSFPGERLLRHTAAHSVPTIVVSGIFTPSLIDEMFERHGVVACFDKADFDGDRFRQLIREELIPQPTPPPTELEQGPQVVGPAPELGLPMDHQLDSVLGTNNLKYIGWIERGIQVSKSVCRVLTPIGHATGFLVAPELVMTNHHVIPSQAVAQQSVVEFNYQETFDGSIRPTCRYALEHNQFHSSSTLDYTLVGVRRDPHKPSPQCWGHVLLNPDADPVPREHVIIIQHPNGQPKQIVLTANQVVRVHGHLLHYTTDTMPGSSGSPVFNDLWQVIAIHHAGGREHKSGQGATFYVNEGILMSAIRQDAGDVWPQ